MVKSKRWIVTTSGNRPLSDITKDLTSKGLAVAQVLDEIGCIIGDASDASAERLRAVAGVTDVSPNVSIHIGPPDSDVTW
jgi:hypothetical protein